MLDQRGALLRLALVAASRANAFVGGVCTPIWDEGNMTPLEQLEAICEEIFERWDKDMRSGKLLRALSGKLPGYRADVDAVRARLASAQGATK